MRELIRILSAGLVAGGIVWGFTASRGGVEREAIGQEGKRREQATEGIVRSVETLERLLERRGVVVGETFLVRERIAGHGGGGDVGCG